VKCLHCGNELNDDDIYCPKCGTKNSHVCPKCGAEVDAGDAYCEKCGTSLIATQESVVKDDKKQVDRNFENDNADTYNSNTEQNINDDLVAKNAVLDSKTTEDEFDYLKPRPWRRYFARFLDIFLIYLLIIVVISHLTFFRPLIYDLHGIKRQIFNVICIWIVFLIEPSIFICFQTTFGKKLFGIKIISKQSNDITYATYLKRNIQVLIRGMWLSIPIISYIAEIFSFVRLKETGSTKWDDNLDIEVHYEWLSWKRYVLICIVCIVTLFFAYYMGAKLSGAFMRIKF